MSATALLRVEYLSIDPLNAVQPEGWNDVLGVASFARTPPALPATIPAARLLLDPRAAPPGGQPIEVWRAQGAVRSGSHGQAHWRAAGGLLFAVVSLPEVAAAGVSEQDALRQVVLTAYRDIYDCLRAFGAVRPLRIWNYLADINRYVEGVERYRIFNEARQQALRSAEQGVRIEVPAACALGVPTGHPFTVYFLACAEDAGVAIENPRQVAAYDYPPEYGTFSPSFSRATLANGATGRVLFISGTASILGHRSVHAGDVAAQTRETLANIAAVVAEANRVAGEPAYDMQRLIYKVYLRHPQDRELVAAVLDAVVRPATPVLYLQADICRADLLVEIEAVGQPTSAGA